MAEVFEARAKQAEEMVRQLEADIGSLRAEAEAALAQKLTKENEELRKKIAAAKSKLRDAETSHGKKQFYVPGEGPKTTATTAATTATAPASATTTSAATPAATTTTAPVAEKKAKEEKKPKDEKKPAKEDKKSTATAGAGAGAAGEDKVDVSRVDFRVGRVVKAQKHPEADKLYLEEIDLGEGKNRTVLSGLADYIPLDQLQNRLVIVCANLPPRKMKGIESQAMIMCANDGNKVEIIDPPAGAVPGDRVSFPEFPGTPDAVLNPKKKIFETVAPDLKTNDTLVATYKGSPFTIAGKGVCKAQSLANCVVK